MNASLSSFQMIHHVNQELASLSQSVICLEGLPLDIWTQITSFLGPNQIGPLSRVSRILARKVNSDVIWRPICVKNGITVDNCYSEKLNQKYREFLTARSIYLAGILVINTSDYSEQSFVSSLCIVGSKLYTGSLMDSTVTEWDLMSGNRPSKIDQHRSHFGHVFNTTDATNYPLYRLPRQLGAVKNKTLKRLGNRVSCIRNYETYLLVGSLERPYFSVHELNETNNQGGKLDLCQLNITGPVSMIEISTHYVFISFSSCFCIYDTINRKSTIVNISQSEIVHTNMIGSGHLDVLFLLSNGDWSLWNFDKEPKCILSAKTNYNISCGCALPKGIKNGIRNFQVIAGNEDGTIQTWDIHQSKLGYMDSPPILFGNSNLVKCMATRHGLLFMAGWDGLIRIYNTANIERLYRILGNGNRQSAITAMEFYDNHIITGHYDGSVSFYNFPDFNDESLL